MARKVRIIHCLEQVHSGGVERRRLDLARYLDKDRYEQKLLCTEAKGPLAAEIARHGVEVIEVGGGAITDWRRYLRAVRIMREWQPDIVHGAVFEGVAVAAVAGTMARVPVIIAEETSHATNRSWKGHLLFRTLVKLADRCVAVSPAVGEYLQQVTRVPAEKICVITNGISPPGTIEERERAAKMAELGVAPGSFVVGSVGRMVDDMHKRFSDLIRATALLKGELPELTLLLVGDGETRPTLEALAQELGVADRVIFAGYQSEVSLMYSLMDLFALVSDREAFGLVLVEAMFHGLPVLATRTGGIPNIVLDQETGILVPRRDPEAIAAAVRRLHDDPGLSKRLGEAGRARAHSHFSSERYLREIDQLYRGLTG